MERENMEISNKKLLALVLIFALVGIAGAGIQQLENISITNATIDNSTLTNVTGGFEIIPDMTNRLDVDRTFDKDYIYSNNVELNVACGFTNNDISVSQGGLAIYIYNATINDYDNYQINSAQIPPTFFFGLSVNAVIPKNLIFHVSKIAGATITVNYCNWYEWKIS